MKRKNVNGKRTLRGKDLVAFFALSFLSLSSTAVAQSSQTPEFFPITACFSSLQEYVPIVIGGNSSSVVLGPIGTNEKPSPMGPKAVFTAILLQPSSVGEIRFAPSQSQEKIGVPIVSGTGSERTESIVYGPLERFLVWNGAETFQFTVAIQEVLYGNGGKRFSSFALESPLGEVNDFLSKSGVDRGNFANLTPVRILTDSNEVALLKMNLESYLSTFLSKLAERFRLESAMIRSLKVESERTERWASFIEARNDLVKELEVGGSPCSDISPALGKKVIESLKVLKSIQL